MQPAPPPPQPRFDVRGAPVTFALVVVNLAVFVVQMALESSGFIADPRRLELALGANYGLATINEHRFETLVTSCFLHGGVMHVALNMIILWQAGRLVERSVGSTRMAPMYLFAGIVGSLASAAVNWTRGSEGYSVGASGAIMGVIAAAAVLGWRVQGLKAPFTQSMLRWLGINLLLGFAMPHTDNAAHIGGAVAGALAALLWRRGQKYTARAKGLVLAGAAAVVLASAAVVALRDLRDPYATLNTEQRVLIATSERLQLHCAEASKVLARTRRLNPRDERVIAESRAFAIDCRGAM